MKKQYNDPRFELVSYELTDVLTMSDEWLGNDQDPDNDTGIPGGSIFG